MIILQIDAKSRLIKREDGVLKLLIEEMAQKAVLTVLLIQNKIVFLCAVEWPAGGRLFCESDFLLFWVQMPGIEPD